MKKLLLAFGVALVVAIAGVMWWNFATSPVNPQDTKTRSFTVSSGEDVRAIAKNLGDQGLIRDPVSFFVLVRLVLHTDTKLQAGSFQLSPAMSAQEVASKLTFGTEDVWITIPEGWRATQILDYLKTQGFDTTSASWSADEGRLFPDTYLVPKLSTVASIHDLMLKNFTTKTSDLAIDNQTLILASMVEREAKDAADRPIVASVFLNRLNAGMGLDVDATVQYAIGYTTQDGWWKKNLTLDDLKIASPYNTYIHAGLPPGPICNPGLSSIDAVLHPTQTNYLYYLTGKDGQMHYAQTLDQHNANVAKYL